MPKSLVEQFYDDDMRLGDEDLQSWSAKEFCQAKVVTVVFDWKAMIWGEQIPRRLGGSASARELSADKKFMRMMAHLNGTLYSRWNPMCDQPLHVDLTSVGPAERRAGAQVDGQEFLREKIYVCDMQMRLVAAVATQVGIEMWGNAAIRILAHELENLKRIKGKYEKVLAG